MEDQVAEFIQRRWTNNNSTFLNGNCYWFARILQLQFPYLSIFYLPIEGHFIAGNLGKYYDATGAVVPQEEPILLSDIRRKDYTWYSRLLKNCKD